MNSRYEDQHARMKRLLLRIDPPSRDHGAQIEYEDNLWAFFQNAWHLKDWIKNDSTIVPFDIEKSIAGYANLQICADLANRSKHLRLKGSRVDAKHSKTNVTVMLGEPVTSYYDYVIEDNSGKEYKVIDLANAIVKDWDDLINHKNGSISQGLCHQDQIRGKRRDWPCNMALQLTA